jgi:hypothetical protein
MAVPKNNVAVPTVEEIRRKMRGEGLATDNSPARLPSLSDPTIEIRLKEAETTILDLRSRLTSATHDLQLARDRITELLREAAAAREKRSKLSPVEMRAKFDEILQNLDIEPAEELLRMATQRTPNGGFVLTDDQRIRIFTELNQYRMPKLKSIEQTGTVQHDHRVLIMRFGDSEAAAVPIESTRTLAIGPGPGKGVN